MEKEKFQTSAETNAENQVNTIIGNSAIPNTQEVNSVVIDETQQNEQSNFAEVSKTRVCSKCGEELQESQLFCPKCGKKYQESKGSKKKVVIISSMVAVILVIAIIAVVLILSKNIQISKITLDKTNLKLNVGDSEMLTIKINPENATDKSVIWISSDDNIVSVVNGKITGVKKGTATITAKSNNGIIDVCTVTVEPKKIQVSQITFDKTNLNLNVGDKEMLMIKVLPENATDKSVIWTSSDNNIVSVVNGKITGVKEGTATITAKSNNGITAICTVAVEEKLPDLKAIYDSLNDDFFCKIASDGSYLSVDTNPLDIDNYSATFAIEYIIKDINEALDLPESILERMGHTRALDGTQSQTYGKINVSWTYHPNQGLEVTYEVIK